MSKEILYVLLGLVAGGFSGIIGLGGGIILVPAFIFLFGMSQQQAQGTTLALMVPPIGILAAYTYYQAGFVDIKVAALVCLGFIFGGWIGAKFAVQMPKEVLQKIFAITLFLISIKMFWGK